MAMFWICELVGVDRRWNVVRQERYDRDRFGPVDPTKLPTGTQIKVEDFDGEADALFETDGRAWKLVELKPWSEGYIQGEGVTYLSDDQRKRK
jgi:hypothetical protein